MHDFTPISALIGGALIGIAASLLLLTHGRVAGISGIYGGIVQREPNGGAMRLPFVIGLLVAGLVARILFPQAVSSAWLPALPLALVAGLVVGFGTRLGGGCTSGHGVCGVSRFSARSLVAAIVFVGTGITTVFLLRHVFGGAR